MIQMLIIDGTYSRVKWSRSQTITKTIWAWHKRSENFLRLSWMSLFKTKEFWSLYHRPENIMMKFCILNKDMSIYGELDPMVERRTQFAFKGKREHIANVNMPNMAYPNQHIDIDIPHGSRDLVIVPDTIKITFNLDIESRDKARGVVNNVGRALVKKKVLILGSKETNMINNSELRYLWHVHRSLSEQKRLWREATSRHTAGQWFKAHVGAKKADGTALTLTTQENVIKNTFDKRFSIPLDFDFFKHPVYPYGLKEDLIVRFELKSLGNVILCTGDTSATYKLSGIFFRIWCNIWWTICHNHKWNVYRNNVNSIYQGRIDSLSDIVWKRHRLENWSE